MHAYQIQWRIQDLTFFFGGGDFVNGGGEGVEITESVNGFKYKSYLKLVIGL